MADLIEQLMDYLSANQTDPLTYLLYFFIFSVAAAIILPIPIEIGLIWNPDVFFPIKALDLGLGKAVGAIAVFYIPILIAGTAKRLERRGPLRRLLNFLRITAEKSGVNRLRIYRVIGDLREAIKAALKKSGISRSRIYGKIKADHATPMATAPVPRWGWIRWLARKSEVLVRKHGVLAMYVLLSIPGMLDTVILYVFAIINMNRTVMTLRDFALANLLAGINRAFIIWALLEILGIDLFGYSQ